MNMADKVKALAILIMAQWEAKPPKAEDLELDKFAAENGLKQPTYLKWGGGPRLAELSYANTPYSVAQVALELAYKRMSEKYTDIRFDKPELHYSPEEIWGWVRD